jgi:hypothetical protein
MIEPILQGYALSPARPIVGTMNTASIRQAGDILVAAGGRRKNASEPWEYSPASRVVALGMH